MPRLLRSVRFVALPLAVALTVPTTITAFPTAAWAQPKTVRDQLPLEARGHWDAGIALASKNDKASWIAARTSFYAAYEMSKNPRVLFNVAVCDKNIGRYDRALATINRELSEGKGTLSPAEVSEAETFASGLKAFVVSIMIDIDQKDADIYIGDDKIDNTKLPGPFNAPVGANKIRATKPGFAEATQTVDLAGGATGNVTIKMQPLERTTVVNVNVIGPAHATVKVDGQEVGQTPLSVPVKVQDVPHQISAEAPGYVTGTQPLTVKDGPPINLTMELAVEQAKGKLLVTARPEGATIEIDGKAVGSTRWDGPVEAAHHQISVKKSGYYTFTYDVDVPKGGERSVTANLNEDRDTSFVPWLIGSIVVGAAVVVGIVVLATPPDQKRANGTLDPFQVSTQHRRPGLNVSGAGFSF